MFDVIREMKMKTTLRFHLTPARMAKINMLARMWRKRNTPPLLVGGQNCTTTLEIIFMVSQKVTLANTLGDARYET